MQAIRVSEFGPPENMVLEEVPSLDADSRELIIDIKAVGVNPVDTYIRSGQYPRKPDLPYTPGIDGAGTILAVGKETSGWTQGNRVYVSGSLSGTYAEQARCSATQVFPLPDSVSFAAGAAVGVPYATAYRALFHRAKAHEGECVLIHGASGAVGIAAIQFAAHAGLITLATAGTEKGCRLAKQQGASDVFDHHDHSHMEAVLEATNGKGVDLVIENLANANLEEDLNVLAKYGRVVVVGSRGSAEIDPRQLMSRDASILGMLLFNISEQDKKEVHEHIVAGLEAGWLKPIIKTELSLANAAQAHHMIMEQPAAGKIVLTTD